MTWLAIKKSFKKASAWCVQHWRWLILFCGFLITYYLGGKKGKVLLLQAKLAKKQYQKEAAAIERAHEQEIKDREKAHEVHDQSLDNISRIRNEQDLALGKRKLKLAKEVTDEDVQHWLDGNNFEEK